MTVSKPPSEQPPQDDTALLIAALNHIWAWYDAQISRGLQMLNYFFVASAVLVTAYVSAIDGKHYSAGAAVALVGIGLTAVTCLIGFRQGIQVAFAGPVLGELQGRVGNRLGVDLTGTAATQTRTIRIAQSPFLVIIAFALAFLVNLTALLYALIH